LYKPHIVKNQKASTSVKALSTGLRIPNLNLRALAWQARGLSQLNFLS